MLELHSAKEALGDSFCWRGYQGSHTLPAPAGPITITPNLDMLAAAVASYNDLKAE